MLPYYMVLPEFDIGLIEYMNKLMFYNDARHSLKNNTLSTVIMDDNIEHYMILELCASYPASSAFCTIGINENDAAFFVLKNIRLNFFDIEKYHYKYSIVENSHNFLFEDN